MELQHKPAFPRLVIKIEVLAVPWWLTKNTDCVSQVLVLGPVCWCFWGGHTAGLKINDQCGFHSPLHWKKNSEISRRNLGSSLGRDVTVETEKPKCTSAPGVQDRTVSLSFFTHQICSADDKCRRWRTEKVESSMLSQLHVSPVRGCVFHSARTPLMQQLLRVAANEVAQIASFVLKLHQTGWRLKHSLAN